MNKTHIVKCAATGKTLTTPMTKEDADLWAASPITKGAYPAGVIVEPLCYTEAEWKEKYKDYEGAGDVPDALVLVPWDDPSETPSEAIRRLNKEVAAAASGQRIL